MSIVEKAIARAHAAKTASMGQVLAPVAPVSTDPPAMVVPTAPTRALSTHAIDMDRLRSEGLLAPLDSARRTTDQYRRIKWPLLDCALGRAQAQVLNGRIIVVTSSVPGEGKTFSSMNLAMTIALERDSSVLLIDADVARPKLTRALNLENRPGLIDLLSEQGADPANFILNTDVHGLSVLPAGRSSRTAPELLGSQRMESLLAQLCQQSTGEIIIIDSAPLLATNEAEVLGRLAGQIVLVVRAGSTLKPAVAEALALLDKSKPIGLVLNQAEGAFGETYYGDYYDYEVER